MSTLAEIEEAADRLAPEEQEELVRHLTVRLRAHRRAVDSSAREEWMVRLENLRAVLGTGRATLSSAQILEDLREDRV